MKTLLSWFTNVEEYLICEFIFKLLTTLKKGGLGYAVDINFFYGLICKVLAIYIAD